MIYVAKQSATKRYTYSGKKGLKRDKSNINYIFMEFIFLKFVILF